VTASEPNLDLGALVPAQGFVIYGAHIGDLSGYSVSSAGDVNGDGFGDLIIGADGASEGPNTEAYAGAAYVVFGTATGFGASLDLHDLTPAQGFAIYGAQDSDDVGCSVSSAGDVDGDGFDDVLMGSRSRLGEVCLIFGTNVGFGASIDLGVLTPEQGLFIRGANLDDRFSQSVKSDFRPAPKEARALPHRDAGGNTADMRKRQAEPELRALAGWAEPAGGCTRAAAAR